MSFATVRCVNGFILAYIYTHHHIHTTTILTITSLNPPLPSTPATHPPDTLMFHLKRFELNFDTFRREKVNDAFPFPKFLNMYPYTKEGLTGQGQGQGQGQGSLLGLGSGSSQSASTSNGTPTTSGGGGGGGVDSSSPRPPAYYQYELAGVVVHTGTSTLLTIFVPLNSPSPNLLHPLCFLISLRYPILLYHLLPYPSLSTNRIMIPCLTFLLPLPPLPLYPPTPTPTPTGTTDSGHYYAYIKDNWSLPTEAKTCGIPQPTTEGMQAEEGKTRHQAGYQEDNNGVDKVVVGVRTTSSSSLQPSPSMSDDPKGLGQGSGLVKEGCRWLEFNDSEVTEFSESRLDAECFGGTTISHDFHKDTKVINTPNHSPPTLSLYQPILPSLLLSPHTSIHHHHHHQHHHLTSPLSNPSSSFSSSFFSSV